MQRYYFILLQFIHLTSWGQNLVPNGDFEYYSSCPTDDGQIFKAIPWFQPYTGGGTNSSSTDYFNMCANSNSFVSVPLNFIGHQFAHSGFGYTGIEVYSGGFDAREYLEVELFDTLIPNATYCLNIYVSTPGDFSRTDGLPAILAKIRFCIVGRHMVLFQSYLRLILEGI
jgi:hypothetical protein